MMFARLLSSRSIGTCAALIAWWACGQLAGQENASKTNGAKSNRGYTISKETTYFTDPLKADGRIDFIAAINAHFAKGVTAENNAARAIVPALDPKVTFGISERREQILSALGMEASDYADVPVMMEPKTYSEAPGGADLKTLDAQYAVALERPWTDDELPELRFWLNANESAMARIAEASRKAHYFVPFVASDGTESLIAILLEHVQQTRSVARAFVIRSNNHIGRGRWKEAWADILTIKELGRLVAQGQTLVENLVGIAITGMACAQANQFVQQAGPADADWETLRSSWKIQPVADIAQSIGVTERAMLIQLACDIFEQPDPSATLLQGVAMWGDGFGGEAGGKLIGRTLHGMLTSGEVKLDDALRYANQTYDEAIAWIDLPDAQAREAAFRNIEEQLQVANSGPPGEPGESGLTTMVRVLSSKPEEPAVQFSKVLLSMIFPAAEQCVRAEYRTQGSLNAVDLAMAARLLQAQTGHLPRSLRELEPLVDEATMNQPLVDEPIALRPDGEGILIYHWSANRIDDGGDIAGESPKDWGIRIGQ
jgi:hypothetical protein